MPRYNTRSRQPATGVVANNEYRGSGIGRVINLTTAGIMNTLEDVIGPEQNEDNEERPVDQPVQNVVNQITINDLLKQQADLLRQQRELNQLRYKVRNQKKSKNSLYNQIFRKIIWGLCALCVAGLSAFILRSIVNYSANEACQIAKQNVINAVGSHQLAIAMEIGHKACDIPHLVDMAVVNWIISSITGIDYSRAIRNVVPGIINGAFHRPW